VHALRVDIRVAGGADAATRVLPRDDGSARAVGRDGRIRLRVLGRAQRNVAVGIFGPRGMRSGVEKGEGDEGGGGDEGASNSGCHGTLPKRGLRSGSRGRRVDPGHATPTSFSNGDQASGSARTSTSGFPQRTRIPSEPWHRIGTN